MFGRLLYVFGFSILILPICSRNQSARTPKSQCFCELQGHVDDCCCDVETTNELNSRRIYPVIEELLQHNYFRFFKVDLKKPCPFWPDDGQCVLRDCHVDSCTEDQLPLGLKSEPSLCSQEQKQEMELSKVDESLSPQERLAFETWREHDDEKMNFCVLDSETSNSTQYVDLLKNPERYTGYAGPSAARVWKAIYEENCFRLVDNLILGKCSLSQLLACGCLSVSVPVCLPALPAC
jgi:hypothetical protein